MGPSGGGGFATPLDYGAEGDGVTDDTANIQRCLDANSVVRFPAGYAFRITAPLYIKRSDACIMGDNAIYTINGSMATLEGSDLTDRKNRLLALKQAMSIIYVDFAETKTDPYAFVVYRWDELSSRNGPLRVSFKDLMIMGHHYAASVSVAATGVNATESIEKNASGNDVIVGGIDAHANISLTRCGFVNLSGVAVNVKGQHSEIRDVSFRKCHTCVQHNSFDHMFRNIWASQCHDLFVSVYSDRANDKYKIESVWGDMLIGDFSRWAKHQTVLISNCWCDLIGGRFINMPTEENGELRGFITGTRINRTNQKEGNASVEANKTNGFYAQVNAENNVWMGNTAIPQKPLFNFASSCANSVFFAPQKDKVVAVNNTLLTSTTKNGSMIFGAGGLL